MRLKLLLWVTLSVVLTIGAQASGQIYRVDVGSRNLVVTCLGEGQPTVVLEAGFGDAANIWAYMNVWSDIAAYSRVCAYSRAGLGSSDAAPGRRDIQDVVNDLGTVLSDGFIKGPVVLVGHSIGGLIINMYAHQHPQKVAGLVLIDSSHPNSKPETDKISPPALLEARAAYDRQNPLPENWNLNTAVSQGETSFMRPGSLGDKPVVVLTADPTLLGENLVTWVKENVWSGYNKNILRAELNVWMGLQNELAALSRNTQHKTVMGSTHFLQFDNPEIVIESIRQVVKDVRMNKSLRSLKSPNHVLKGTR